MLVQITIGSIGNTEVSQLHRHGIRINNDVTGLDIPVRNTTKVYEVQCLAALKNNGLAPIFLIAPTSTEERIKMIAEVSSGFVYYVSLKGVTGAATLDVESVTAKLDIIRRFIDLPLGVGFGISDAESARQVSECADAVVVGSAIVKRMVSQETPSDSQTRSIINEVSTLLISMRAVAPMPSPVPVMSINLSLRQFSCA